MNWQDFQWLEKQVAAILAALKHQEAKMSALGDAITAVNTEVTNLQTTLVQLGTDLSAEIARLQAGGVSAADLANLATIATNIKAAAATVTGLDTQATGA